MVFSKKEKPKHASTSDKEKTQVIEPVPVVFPVKTPALQTATTSDAPQGEIPPKKAKKGKKVLKICAMTLGIIVAAVAVVYLAGVVVFFNFFFPSTSMSGRDVSLKSNAEIVEMLSEWVDDYQLDITGHTFSYRVRGDEMGIDIDPDNIIRSVQSDLSPWRWPYLITQESHDETQFLVVSFKKSKLKTELTEALDTYNETATPPTDARVVFNKKENQFIVKPEELGDQLSVDATFDAVCDAMDELKPKLVLDDSHLVQPKMTADNEKIIEAAQLATGMVSVHLSLKMVGQPAGEVDSKALSSFISISDTYDVTFKEEELNKWIDLLAEQCNTIGSRREYIRPDGKKVSVEGGVYGWEIDKDSLKESVLEGIKNGATDEIDIPCIETAEVYKGANKPDWGKRYIDVDITEQHVRFYNKKGKLIWESDCVSGKPDGEHDTKEGVWTVNAKESPSRLVGYEHNKKIYEVTVKYWMPFEGNGIGFHDATWQPGFGGSMYANGYGSHGCVNLSYAAAEELYSLIEVGDVVVVHL